jgi:hypothetical protein
MFSLTTTAALPHFFGGVGGDVWCLDEQMIIWVDSETFEWEGFPLESELPADYQIEYIRLWQK